MVPIEDALKDLSTLGTKLKSETEELNEVIANLNQRLKETRIGVSAWTGILLDEKDKTEVGPYNSEVVLKTGWELGYAKVDDAWTIAVRHTSCDRDGEEGGWRDEIPISLLKAPRHVRVESADHLETLIEKIADRARRFIASIEKAKKLK